MDNVNQPQGRDPQGHEPTQPFRFTPGWPGGAAGHDQPSPGYDQAPPEHDQLPPGHGQAPPGYGPVPPGFGQAPPEYSQAPPEHGQVPPGYGPTRPGYGQAPPGYGEDTTRYGPVPPPYYQGAPWRPSQPGGPYWTPRIKPRHRALRWGAGVTAAALLGAGGALAGLKLTGNSSIPGNSAKATALNNALSPSGSCQAAGGSSSAGSAGSGGSGTQAGQGRQARCHPHRLRLLRLVQGMYGEVAFYTQHGTETLAFERGMIASVSGNSVAVRASNGTTWTWTLASNSIIKKEAGAATGGGLSAGERVFVGGQVSGGARNIRLILVREQGQAGSRGTQPGSPRPSSSHTPSGTFTLPPH